MDVDLEHGVGVIVAPLPVSLLITVGQSMEFFVLAVMFLHPHPIGLVFMVIPCVIVIVMFVVVLPIVTMIIGSGGNGRECKRYQKGRAK